MRDTVFLMILVVILGLSACRASDEAAPHPDTRKAATAEGEIKAETMVGPTPPEEIVANDNCDINAPLAGGTFDRSGKLAVWGYAIDKPTWSVPPAVSIRISAVDSAEKINVLAARSARHDVAEAFNRPELENSGFGAEVDVTGLTPGSYMVSVLQDIKGKVYVCNNAQPILLR